MSEHTHPAGRVYSQRLGVLTPDQFQAALARFALGDFVEAAPVSQGLFGQNVFVTSTHGQYVLRGVAHYPWQFPKERFGAALLHERTRVPVAHPYLLDASTDIFGWSYILMPRLRGTSPADSRLTDAERLEIAGALGRNLAQMHALHWPFVGEYDLASDTIQPFAEDYPHWFASDVRRWLTRARENGPATTADDVGWVEQVIRDAQPALAVSFRPSFVMNDYNLGNLLVSRVHGEWEVTGLFDLMEYYFGDGEADLMRLIGGYMDRGRPDDMRLAHAFGATYLASRPPRPGFAERYPLFMLRDRLITWEYGTRPGNNWFPEGQSFRDYAERYVASHSRFDSAVR
jgi:hygromycin-B 7''-O-kinase